MTHSFGDQGDRASTQHVPLLIRVPEKWRKKTGSVSAPVTIADIAPTIYEIFGFNWYPLTRVSSIGNYGRSLLPALGLEPDPTNRPVRLPEDRTRSRQDDEALRRLRALGYLQ